MAVKRKTFFNTPWNERGGFEKAAIITGSAIGVYAAYNGYKTWKAKQDFKKAVQLQQMMYSQGSPVDMTGLINTLSPGAAGSNVQAIVDQVAELTIGTNVVGHPDEVNQLATLSPTQLQQASLYWDSRFRQLAGGRSLKAHLQGESAAWLYSYAIDALTNAGLSDGGSQKVNWIPLLKSTYMGGGEKVDWYPDMQKLLWQKWT